jgi:hypothetical protein
MAMDMLTLGESIRELEETGSNADEETMGTPKGYEVSYKPFTISGNIQSQRRANEINNIPRSTPNMKYAHVGAPKKVRR